jgi:antitoxin StbD
MARKMHQIKHFIKHRIYMATTHSIYASTTVSMTDLRRNPSAILQDAGDSPIAVLNHNKPAGYIVSTVWMERVLDALADRVVADTAIKRLGTLKSARVLNPSDL